MKAPLAGTLELIIVTAVITALVSTLFGVFGKRAADFVLDLILKPVHFLSEMIYMWIAPRNPFSISLISYKRHVARSKLARIENPIGPNLSVPLEYAFAPLKLISSNTQETVDLFAYVASSFRCILLGGPGTGKTTLMKSLVTSMVRRRSHDVLNDLVPVFVVLRNLAKKEHTIEQAITATFADYHFPGADKFVESALSQGRMLIVLDGLDEVGASREFVAGEIVRFCEHDDQQQKRNRVIITCREYSYRTRDLQSVVGEVVRVEPFANHHMRVFLQGWPAHKGRLAIRLYTLIQNDPQLRDICRNPLLLTILTGLFLDTDNFEMPTSRDRFYKAAVDELLVHRPARRQIRQVFDAEDKRHILERVALERLETAQQYEDPEEFSRAAIVGKADEVLREDDFDFHELIKELIDINGIIRPTDEETYTCAHRTIQEYLAAREALRIRKTEEVVETFGPRPELIEVLYFYCGLINNIPSLTFVVNAFAREARWLEAGRVLLHAKESLGTELISRVGSSLRTEIARAANFNEALELLSSLAQRSDLEFQNLRSEFSQAIDNLASRHGEHKASALESALAASPEAAMKVIPGLLRHDSPRLKSTAVNLLRDIGTDEALDQLVQLTTSKDQIVRRRASSALAKIIKSRNKDLKNRVALLPERKDDLVWPFESYFPGTIAIPIAESLVDAPPTGNLAIDSAVKVLRLTPQNCSRSDAKFLKKWRQVPRDLALERYRTVMSKLMLKGGATLAFSFPILFLCVLVLGYYGAQTITIATSAPRLRTMDNNWLQDVASKTDAFVNQVGASYPPNASGWQRVWPWNWNVEPEIPRERTSAFETVKSFGTAGRNADSYYLLDNAWVLGELSNLKADAQLAELQVSVKILQQHLEPRNDAAYVIVTPPFHGRVEFVMLAFFLLVLVGLNLHSLFTASEPFSGGVASMILVFAVAQGTMIFRILPAVLIGGPLLLGFILPKLGWPKNQLLKAVDDVTPQEMPNSEATRDT